MSDKLKVGFVVQRYGREVNGGAEQHCKNLAERIAKRSEVERVTVFTSCAIDYESWKNEYAPGVEQIEGVSVERFAVPFGRLRTAQSLVGLLTRRAGLSALERAWVVAQGPYVPGLVRRLSEVRADYDAFVFVTYLDYPTVFGLPEVAERSVFLPTAHDEWQIFQKVYAELFAQARALAFNTPEERDFVYRTFPVRDLPAEVVGSGMELPPPRALSAREARARAGIDAPYVLYLGRLSTNKGVPDLFPAFERFQARHGDQTFFDADGEPYRGRDLKLVLAGRRARISIPSMPRLEELGFVDDARKQDLLAGTEILLLPSRFESMSLVVLEAWSHSKPVLVERRCEVTSGVAARGGGGLPFEGPEELVERMTSLLRDPQQRRELGAAGHRYVVEHCSWQRAESLLLSLIRQASPSARSC
jgi:glycosyltransferase involved in cell wall biosynthesis